jgi:orotate phosphoribosyltransferase
MTEHQQLIALLKARSVRHGRFTLSSGKPSDLYIDVRLTSMSPDGLGIIGPLVIKTIRHAGWTADSIGGMTLGADPIAYAASYASNFAPPPIRAFTVRKEAKTHGTAKRIEGPFLAGDIVVIIEDVITTGGSALQAIDVVSQKGGRIAGVLSVVDREEGGRQVLESKGYQVISLVSASELRTSPL